MKDYNEKRACQRCTYEAPITCAYFNADKFYRAKTINHSKNGMYFKSDFPLKPGASVYIRRIQKKTGTAGIGKGGTSK